MGKQKLDKQNPNKGVVISAIPDDNSLQGCFSVLILLPDREQSVLLRILNLSTLEGIKVGDTLEFSKKLSPETVNVTIDSMKLNFSALTIEEPKSQLLINSHQVRHNPATQTVAISQTPSHDIN